MALACMVAAAAPVLAFEDQVQSISAELAEEIQAEGKKTVAVVDFTDLQGNVTELGRFLAEEFSVALAGAEQDFEVIDRTHLASIIREHKLAQQGLIDPQTARELGKITGVEALVTGTLTPFGDSVRVQVKLLDSESARLVASSRGKIPRTEAINDLLEEGISRAISGGSSERNQDRDGGEQNSQHQVQQASNFKFRLQYCQLSGSSLSCHLTIENESSDRDISIHDGSTRAFAPDGSEHYPSRAYLGGHTNLRRELIRGVPIQLEIVFTEFPSNFDYLTALELVFWARDSGKNKVQFRNIPLRDNA